MDSSSASPSRRRFARLARWVGPVVVLAGIGGAILWLQAPERAGPLAAPGLAQPVDAAGLRGEGYAVTIAVLGTIYDAFARTDEAAIYDGLAEVAAGDALEALYLERAGALASGGLPDQLLLELRLTGGTWTVEDGAMRADIRWAVLGQVGHSEHTHMRGNAYAAELTIAPADGAWRLTEFTLTEVDRTETGTLTTETAQHDASVPAQGPPG